MFAIVFPIAFILGTIGIKKCALSISFTVWKVTVISVSQRVLCHFYSSQIPIMFSNTILFEINKNKLKY